MNTSSIRNSRRLPKFITTHKVFSNFDKIEKVFPKIGLENCSANVTQYMTAVAKQFKASLIKEFYSGPYIYNSGRRNRIRLLVEQCGPGDFISHNKWVVPRRLRTDRVAAVTTTFSQALVETRFRPGCRPQQGSGRKCEAPVISKSSRIIFSSSGPQGVWDMSTMSMRGISSCQSWTGCYKRNLVGSIVDPCAGIIYLTNGFQFPKGSRMSCRAVVRYVTHRQTHRPALFLERIYPCEGPLFEKCAQALFIQFLKDKTKNKLQIITSNARGYSIPNSPIVRNLSSCGIFDDSKGYCLSYRDSGISYSKSNSLYLKKITRK